MEVSAKILGQEGNLVTMEVTVSAADLKQAVAVTAKNIAKEINIPGFRAGKVPQLVVENYVGEEALLQESMEEVVQGSYGAALDQTGAFPVDRPKIEVVQLEKDKEVIYKAIVTVKPEVLLGQYKGLEAEKEVYVPTEEDIAAEITRMQERIAKVTDMTEAGYEIVDGDIATIDFEGFVGDVAFEGGKGEKYLLGIGTNTFIPGFEEQLIGKKVGENVDVCVTFPAEYGNAELAGAEAVFKVFIHEAKHRELPEVNDEFVKDVREDVDTVEELKAKIKEEMEARSAEMAADTAKNSVIEVAVKNATVDIPAAMVDDKLDQMLDEFSQQLAQQGLDLAKFFQLTKSTRVEWKAAQKERAEFSVKQDLVLEAIVKAEGIEADQADIDKQMEELALAYGRPVEDIKKTFATDESLKFFNYNVKMLKAIEVITESAVIK